MFNRWKSHGMADRAREMFDDTRDLARERAAEANSFIHDQPVAATLLGVGAGFAIGMIYRSIRRPARPEAPERRRPSVSRKSRKTARS